LYGQIAGELETAAKPFKLEIVRLLKENSNLRVQLLQQREGLEEQLRGSGIQFKIKVNISKFVAIEFWKNFEKNNTRLVCIFFVQRRTLNFETLNWKTGT
jgi:hypothetical protein